MVSGNKILNTETDIPDSMAESNLLRNSGPRLLQSDAAYWRLGIEKDHLGSTAIDYVVRGDFPSSSRMPIAQFGKLRTVDRAEIEGYRTIRNLMMEFVTGRRGARPLCIAVFG